VKAKTNNQDSIERKKKLLSALLSREIAPEEFKERVKESGLPTRNLTPKEQWLCDMEFSGKNTIAIFGHEKYTYQEVLDRFDEFEARLATQKIRSSEMVFPLDPDSIISKISDEKLSNEERRHILKTHCERWGKPYHDV
jgi:hypothetical protein